MRPSYRGRPTRAAGIPLKVRIAAMGRSAVTDFAPSPPATDESRVDGTVGHVARFRATFRPPQRVVAHLASCARTAAPQAGGIMASAENQPTPLAMKAGAKG